MGTQATGKVLRIGIIVDGRIVQERMIKAGQTVTIGASRNNTFIVPGLALPRQDWALFVADRGRYALCTAPGMKGKVGASGAVAAIDPAAGPLALTEADRGKIGIGPATVLFQFVAPPPTILAGGRVEFRPRLVHDDDALLFGTLSLFGSIGAMFVVWARLTSYGIDSEETPDFTQPWTKIAVYQAPERPAIVKPTSVGTEPSPIARVKPSVAKPQPAPARPEVSHELSEYAPGLFELTTRGENAKGITAPDGWRDNAAHAIATNLDQATGIATDGKQRGMPPANPDGLADIDGTGLIGNHETTTVREGPIVHYGTVEVPPPTDLDPTQDGEAIRAVVNRNAGTLKACYEDRLNKNPSLAGRLEVDWNVSHGRVTSASASINTTNDAEFAACVERKITRWQFPETVTTEISWPFIFRAKN
jgi:hypothetical protein